MNIALEKIKKEFIEQIRKSEIVLGAWNFGSETHGLSDEYSDVDIVLLIEGKSYAHSADTIEGYLKNVCNDILLCYPEGFNGEAIVNNGYLISCGDNIFQFDVFLLNSEKLNDYICRLHYTGLTEQDIIFDKIGMVKELISLNLKGDFWNDDLMQLQNTYWYHAYMTQKYLIRKDYFKLYNILHTLYETHVSLLLTGFDKITWGGNANKLHFIPKDKQQHLKRYYCLEDFDTIRNNLMYCMKAFDEDAKEVCMLKGIGHSATAASDIINLLKRVL